MSVPDGIFGNGELGVGTQDPAANIHIIGSSNDDPLLIVDDAGATKVKLASNGRLGLGTADPEAGIHVLLPDNDESDLLKLSFHKLLFVLLVQGNAITPCTSVYSSFYWRFLLEI